MHIFVVYALPQKQFLEEIDVPEGTTAEEAVRMSGLLEKCPDIDLAVNKLGIFAKLVQGSQELKAGDRVEVYRALPAKARDAHEDSDKKARIRAKKERQKD